MKNLIISLLVISLGLAGCRDTKHAAVKTLKKVGRYIRGEETLPADWDPKAFEDAQKQVIFN